MSHIRAILFDIGDTLVSEETLIKDSTGITLRADFWPGMVDALRRLRSRGYTLGIVADISRAGAANILSQEHIDQLFDAQAISQRVGVDKPDPRIFRDALDALGVEQPDYGRVLHVGNNLERDVAGANGLGLTSVWIRWSERYRGEVQAPWEVPDYTVHSAAELLALIDELERGQGEDVREVGGRLSLPSLPSFPRSGSQTAKWGSVPPTSDLPSPTSDLELAARYAPTIRLDRHEPFPPLVVGYTVFRQDGYSPSFPRCIGLTPIGRKPAALAVEYAVWSDWDIQHLYELEHVWAFVDAEGDVIWAEGSWHGDFWELRTEAGAPALDGTHPLAYSQPGKHAFVGTPQVLLLLRDHTAAVCELRAGTGGCLVSPIFSTVLRDSPRADDLARRFLQAKAFVPTHQFDQEVRVTADLLVPWPVLERWIPARMSWWLGELGDAPLH